MPLVHLVRDAQGSKKAATLVYMCVPAIFCHAMLAAAAAATWVAIWLPWTALPVCPSRLGNPPKDVVFLVDVSEAMKPNSKIDGVRQALEEVVRKYLQACDHAAIVTYADAVKVTRPAPPRATARARAPSCTRPPLGLGRTGWDSQPSHACSRTRCYHIGRSWGHLTPTPRRSH